MDESHGARPRVPLSPRERRVAGVLVEKQKTTPDAYPMTLAAITTGCNQKSNREPVTSYEADDVEATLQDLRLKGAAVRIEGSGRVEKWKHNLYEWLNLRNRPVEMAILAELLLRGAQTEGELRARASRMDPIPDLDALGRALEHLQGLDLIVYLTPPGQRRGVSLTHNLYEPGELTQLRQHYANRPAESEIEAAPGPSPKVAVMQEVADLRERLERAERQIARLNTDVEELRSSLGG